MKVPTHYLLTVLMLFIGMNASAQKPSLIPIPQTVSWNEGQFIITPKTSIGYTNDELKPAASYLQAFLKKSTGFPFHLKKGKGTIMLTLLSDNRKEGAYNLTVGKKGIHIDASSYQGVIHGISTLRQLLPEAIEAKTPTPNTLWKVPFVRISDSPRFAWRGMELDVSRHFFSKEEVKELLDLLTLYKINKFHWHLTDDQGWRVEIKKYPLLTQNGGFRTYNNLDSVCISRAQKEDNPQLYIPENKMRDKDGKRVYGGYYTQEDIKEIVAYAMQRGIDIIPEVDMPGHSLCAIENYNGLSCFPTTTWRTFSSPLCPGKDKVLAFCKDVWTEIFSLFPYKYAHIGGDEVEMVDWKNCPDCQKRIKDNNLKDEHALQSWFNKQMESFFHQHGKTLVGWDEILQGGASSSTAIMWWRSWAPNTVETSIKNGNQVICTPNVQFYLDYTEDETSIGKIYGFDPYPSMITPEQKDLVLGVQGNLWTEWVPTRERMLYMSFPRQIAIAELGWSDTSRRDIKDFNDRLHQHFVRLQHLHVPYRTPGLKGFYDKNVFIDKQEVNLTCSDPSATIRYTTDGTIPNHQSCIYQKGMTVDENTDFMFRIFDYAGNKGETYKAQYVKGTLMPAVQVDAIKPGLSVAWYDYAGEACRDIETAKHLGTFQVSDIVIPKEAKNNIGLIFDGFIRIPADGIYTFFLLSDDGSILEIDNQVVVDNDGGHSPKEKTGQHAMKAGLHKIHVRYFDHNGGMLRMKVCDANGNMIQPEYVH